MIPLLQLLGGGLETVKYTHSTRHDKDVKPARIAAQATIIRNGNEPRLSRHLERPYQCLDGILPRRGDRCPLPPHLYSSLDSPFLLVG